MIGLKTARVCDSGPPCTKNRAAPVPSRVDARRREHEGRDLAAVERRKVLDRGRRQHGRVQPADQPAVTLCGRIAPSGPMEDVGGRVGSPNANATPLESGSQENVGCQR